MKKYCFLLITILLGSCSSEFLDINPKGALYAESFYATADDLDMAVTGMYERLSRWTEYSNDLVYCTAGNDKTSQFDNWQEVDVFDTEGDNSEMATTWAELYVVINAANELLDRYQSADATEEKKNVNAAQAHFFRAFCYFMLVRAYNEIPFYTSSSQVSTDLELSDSKEIYEQIISDLKIAETDLPDNWDSDSERAGVAVTNGAAKALLAYVYLCEAGYPVKKEGAYALAAAKAKEVMDGASTWGYRLMDNIADLYSKDYNYENYACDEVIFATFNEDEYSCPLASFPSEFGGWDVYYAEISFFEDYPAGVRKDAVFQWEFPQEDGTTKHYTEMNSKHPYYKQYWDGKLDWDAMWEGMDWQNSRPQVALTYSNNLLVYAEAKAMSDGVDASAYKALNDIRKRAGLSDIATGLTAEQFRDSVVRERSWEFCGGYYCIDPWYDLVRLERVEESINNRNAAENPIVNTVSKDSYFAPYPENDALKNPNLSR